MGAASSSRQFQSIVRDAGRTRRDLVVVKLGEDVLGVAPIDTIAIAVDDVGVDEVRPRIDGAVRLLTAALAEDVVAAGDGDFEPDLVGVRCSLGEQMAERERAQHDVDDVFAPGSQHR